MNLSIVPLPISVACFCWLPVAGFAESESQELRCGQAALWRAPSDSSHYRKYAPDRKVDMLHLALDVTPDFKQRTIAGQATLRFKPLAQPLEELQLDGIDLTVHAVTSSEKIVGYQATDKQIIVNFAPPIPVSRHAWV